jgi:hypothetical protein
MYHAARATTTDGAVRGGTPVDWSLALLIRPDRIPVEVNGLTTTFGEIW